MAPTKEPRAGKHWSIADTPCPWCGMKAGSNRGRCLRCWDDWVDFNLACYLDRWEDKPEFEQAAIYFYERTGSMLRPW